MFVIIGDKSRDHSWLNVSSQASSVPPFAPPNHRLLEGSATPMASDLAAKAKEAYIDDHFELAVELYSQGILIDPNNSELFSDRAQANIKLKNFTGRHVSVLKNIRLPKQPLIEQEHLWSESLARSLKQTVVDNDNISFLDAAKSAGYAKTDDFSNVFLKLFSFCRIAYRIGTNFGK
ncbi:hypothetical protein LXL04_003845 [Taraxacum kok-saghyz]